MLRHLYFDHMPPTRCDIGRIRFLYGCRLEHPRCHLPSELSDIFLSGTVVFLDPKNKWIDIKISIISDIKAEIFV